MSVDTLESLEGAAFEELFGLSKEKYEDLPPFRRNQKKATAQAKRHVELKAIAERKVKEAAARSATRRHKIDARLGSSRSNMDSRRRSRSRGSRRRSRSGGSRRRSRHS